MKLAWRWLGVALLFVLPWLLLVLAGLLEGAYWLWQQQLLLPWLALLLALSAAAWSAAEWLGRKAQAPFRVLPEVMADALWPPASQEAWRKVQALAAGVDVTQYPLTDVARLWGLGWQVVETVARHFHPEAARAELAVPLPYIFAICEKVSHDMGLLLAQHLPLSHRLSLADALGVWRGIETAGSAGDVLRVGRLALHPLTGLTAEAGHLLAEKALRYPKAQLHRWALETLIKKVGYYAIALYSGQLRLQEGPVDTLSGYSAADSERAAHPVQDSEPLRILVAGQLKAGKSSLVNGLFGELRAATDVLPLTAGLTPYRLERDGMLQALLFDSAGYGDDVTAWCRAQRQHLERMDVVLLACSAIQAARQCDAQFLRELHSLYAARPERAPPVLLVALTHIDRLRPLREWQPPYDLQQSHAPKAQSIRGALQAVAEALQLPPEDIIPVSLLQPAPYNLDALWTSIAAKLPEALRARYLRCLRDTRAAENWALLWRQLSSAGRFAVGGMRKWFS